MDWKQELLKRLDSLGATLGSTGAHLWGVLVRQSIAMGVADLVVSAICFALIFVGVHYAKVCYSKIDHDEIWTFPTIIIIVATVVLCLLTVANVYDATLELINPEYYALEKILQTVGK